MKHFELIDKLRNGKTRNDFSFNIEFLTDMEYHDIFEDKIIADTLFPYIHKNNSVTIRTKVNDNIYDNIVYVKNEYRKDNDCNEVFWFKYLDKNREILPIALNRCWTNGNKKRWLRKSVIDSTFILSKEWTRTNIVEPFVLINPFLVYDIPIYTVMSRTGKTIYCQSTNFKTIKACCELLHEKKNYKQGFSIRLTSGIFDFKFDIDIDKKDNAFITSGFFYFNKPCLWTKDKFFIPYKSLISFIEAPNVNNVNR